jgi:hypothetical protein
VYNFTKQDRTDARKLSNFWASIRSTQNLIDNAPAKPNGFDIAGDIQYWQKGTDYELEQLLEKQKSHILDKGILIYPLIWKHHQLDENTSYKEKRRILGYQPRQGHDTWLKNYRELRFNKFMSNQTHNNMKKNWEFRIAEEARMLQEAKWYPFFVTLTVDPFSPLFEAGNMEFVGPLDKGQERKERHEDHVKGVTCPETLWKSGKPWRDYIRKLCKEVTDVMGHPEARKKTKEYNYRPESDYVRYAAVIEHGASGKHHHCHMILWMKDIPSHWKICPNKNLLPQNRTKRRCESLETHWPWCTAQTKPAYYLRTAGDIWSQAPLNHCVPLDVRKKDRPPIKISAVGFVGKYICKYMQKGYKKWHHRMKCTRNLGLTRLTQKIESLPLAVLEALTWRPKNSKHRHSVSLTHSVPIGLIRLIATRQSFLINFKQKRLDLENLMTFNYALYPKMLKNVLDGVRPDRMPSAEFYDWVSKHLPDQKGYCKDKLVEAHKLFSKNWPRPIFIPERTPLPGADIGPTCIFQNSSKKNCTTRPSIYGIT